MLELRSVSKRFAAVGALNDVSLTLPRSRTTVLIGPSGCGKSTILRLMIGLIAPDRGQVYFDGVELSRDRLAELRRRMGYVIQDGGLFPHLSARANVVLMARHLGWPADRMQRRVSELADLVHLGEAALDRYPLQMSGGQRQRVSLMRALFLDPAVLLLDEPLGSLDPMIRADLQEDLRAVFRQLGKTVVLVTHDLSEAAFFGDCIVLLRDGAVVQEGCFEDLLRAPAHPFVTQFVNAQRTRLVPLAGAASAASAV